MKEKHPLRIAREAHDLKMRELANDIGLGKGGWRRIYEWEHGKHIPTRMSANALADKLGFESGEKVRELCLKWKESEETNEQPASASDGG
jgi:ribosome-binding protein aMBF1 (putative translation factor)